MASGLEKSPISAFKPGHSRSNSTGSSSRHSRQNSRDWEIVTDPLPSVGAPGHCVEKSGIPGICEGYLMKKRKYPLQGWHKRYFILEKGILRYSKTQQDIARGKVHGSMDVSLAVMSMNKKSRRIDLDAGQFNLYHIKAKSQEIFYIWLTKLTAHRKYKKNEAMIIHQDVLQALSAANSNALPAMASLAQRNRAMMDMVSLYNYNFFFFCKFYFLTIAYFYVPKPASVLYHAFDFLFLRFLREYPSSPSQSRQTRSRLSLAESMAEYFDANEVIVSESLSENEASDESGLSDVTTSNSEPEDGHADRVLMIIYLRRLLPAHSADNSHIGILSILYNNIGKDLSRVSMPVALNEPVNFLQRVSEELEYSQLLDIANQIDDPYQRMVYVAVFSISGYAWASWRNRYKPFNPVLGETYESVREERGFRYVAEQVSHHPPVSACHAESENFTFWQDQRWKNKFWGKSVEIISTGMVNVTLPRYGDHYEWNKVVTCIHSVFSQQRWLEHYGDVVIKNLNSDECTCKMTFLKTIKNEVQGTVLDQAGNVVHRFGGSWHEGIFCDTLPEPQCIWKPNPQPDDYFDYYGFSSYARELNDLTPDLKPLLPPTDTRFRPDQRLLEEGKVSEADKKKDELEEKQRERRKELTKRGEEHIPRFFRKTVDEAGREVWVTNGTYWRIRENPGFANTPNLELW
uniref:Oxysterol-binding protein n=1 Tax=Astyanax mexicanus TaxID=7994 RepID=A0A8B9RFT2_ASTMX